jgi:hypothetical protein
MITITGMVRLFAKSSRQLLLMTDCRRLSAAFGEVRSVHREQASSLDV